MRHVFLAVVLFSVFLCYCPVVYGNNLYPSCGGEEIQGTAIAGGESTLHTIPQPSFNLTLTCLAYEITSVKGGLAGGNDPCSVEHQTEYLYRLILRATYKDSTSGKSVSVDYDVKDVVGGSLTNIAIRLPQSSRFSLVLINKGTNKKCSLNARAIMDFVQEAKDTQNPNLPVVVGIMPRTVYTNRSGVTNFVLRYPKGYNVESTRNDSVMLAPLSTECFAGRGFVMRLPSVMPNLDFFEDKSALSVYNFYFDKPEAYRVCYKFANDNVSSELAVVGVFDGNPSYYQVISGQDEKGHVTVGVRTTVKFYGYDLDTRPGGDSAKFVNEHEACAAGAPAGGVPEATDLGPSDDYGPETTYTLWTWVLQDGGAYKVCYRRRYSGWTEVPSAGEAGSAAPSPTPAADIPRPTDPASRVECPMAPEPTPERPWAVYKAMKLTMRGASMADDLIQSISKAFCIPRAALSVAHKSHNAEGKQVVFLAIYCDDLDAPRPCDTLERQNYMAYIGSINPDVLSELDIASIEGSKHMFARGDDVVIIQRSGHVFAVVISCLTALSVTAMAVYGFLKYREKREYFIHFGTDEGDVEDMYVSGAGGGGDEFGESHRRPIRDAVIEVED